MAQLLLELEGKVSIVEKDDDGKELSRGEIDGDICLKILMHAIEEGLTLLEKKLDAEKLPKKEDEI